MREAFFDGRSLFWEGWSCTGSPTHGHTGGSRDKHCTGTCSVVGVADNTMLRAL
jgi:hypothetical protein